MSDAGEVTEATEAEPTTEEAAQDPLFDKLIEHVSAAAGAPDEPEAKDTKPEDSEAKEETAQAEDPEWDDLGDDKPWTPERHKKVAEQHRRDRQKITSLLTTLGKREKKFSRKLGEFRQQKQQSDLFVQTIMNDIKMAREGTREQALAALGRLANRDPMAYYEDISLAALGKAGQPKKDPALSAVESKVDTLLQKLEQRDQQQEETLGRAQAERQVLSVLQSPEEWPILAQHAKDAPQETAAEFWELYERESRAAKRWLDVESFTDRIERALRRKSMASRQPTIAATGSGPGRDQETRAQAKPEMAQSPPRSLSPSQSATTGGARRELTEEELKDEFVRNPPPGFFENLFG